MQKACVSLEKNNNFEHFESSNRQSNLRIATKVAMATSERKRKSLVQYIKKKTNVTGKQQTENLLAKNKMKQKQSLFKIDLIPKNRNKKG